MIDPKLNEIPVAGRTAADRPTSETEAAERQRRGRAGLSISDTIAGDTMLSAGGRGVDTSGVSAGSGAGAGGSIVTPGRPNESPAPNVVPGSRSTGTTPRSTTNQDDYSDSATPATVGAGVNVTSGRPHFADVHSTATGLNTTAGTPNTLQIAQRAYEIWCAKGCPEGTADEDWWQAEHDLTRRSETLTATAGR